MPREFRTHPVPAVAACAFEVQAGTAEVQLLPAGRFRAQDGRPTNAESWVLDADIAARVIARAADKANRLVIDYEHQTLYADMNGQPAPAAGWFKQLEFRPDSGLWATDVEWTDRARAMIAAGEYRYISAVFSYLPDSGEVLQILNAGLTNVPALDGMAELQLAAAAKFSLNGSDQEDDIPMNPEIARLLGLQKEASDEAVIAALTALKAQADAATAKDEQIAALKAAEPDPAKYVPVKMAEDLKGELAALRKQITEAEIDELVTAALSDGRLLPAQEEWARKLGAADTAALKTYLETAQPIAALKGTQTGGKQPENKGDGKQLTEGQLAVCRRLGLDEAAYLEALPTE